MSHRTFTPHRLVAGIGIAALTALMAVGTAGVASAADPIPPVSTITGTSASLHITKYVQPDVPGAEADGTLRTFADGTEPEPLPGITFAAQRVPDIDLTTNAGWVAASNMTVATAQTAVGLVVDSTPIQTTNSEGQADFTNLPLGLYLVTETSFPASVTPSAPFLVTLPMTNPTNRSEWMYDVYVYPKNAVTTATKTVQDANAVKLGDAMSFTITADIPHVVNPAAAEGTNDGAIDKYVITDDLDAKVDYASADVTVTDMTDSHTAPTLTAGTDYTIDPTAATTGGPLVTITFTETGRNVLANLWQDNLDAKVQVALHATVNAVGEIENTATLFPNSSSTGMKTNSVTTKWGGITILKQDASTHEKLAGATFQVYVTGSASIQPDASAGSAGGPLSIGTSNSWTTVADGTVTIDGLRYSDWADGAAVADGDAGYHQYWLVETVAPDGYELLAKPIPFTVTGASAGKTITVDNVPHNGGFPLPLTGGSGTAAFTVGGVILLLLAGGGYLVAARRRRAEG